MTPTNVPAYTRTAVLLHWLIALLIVISFGVGLYMVDLKLSPTKLKIYSYHKWVGVSIFALVVIRLLWRATHRTPALPNDMPDWQRRFAEAMHWFLYLLILVIPISGWLMSSAKGFQTVVFGVLPIPDLIGKDKELGDTLAQVHAVLNYLMAGLVVIHAAAAIKHHFVDRDDVLARMLPFLNRTRTIG